MSHDGVDFSIVSMAAASTLPMVKGPSEFGADGDVEADDTDVSNGMAKQAHDCAKW
jgi:hypothetical protein